MTFRHRLRSAGIAAMLTVSSIGVHDQMPSVEPEATASMPPGSVVAGLHSTLVEHGYAVRDPSPGAGEPGAP